MNENLLSSRSQVLLSTGATRLEHNKPLARMCRVECVSLDIQGAKTGPHRYARAPQLWALGIGAVISGQYYGWQSALIAGFDGMLFILCMVTVLYVMLSFSIAELSATIPAGGGPYIFTLHAIGPRAAFFSGLAETLKVIAVNASTFYTVYSYLQALFDVDVKFAPVFFIAFGILFLSLNIFGVQASFRMQACSTTLCVVLLLIFFVSSIPYLDYNKWVVEQHWEFTSLDNTIHAIPFAMWFYLGIEELHLPVTRPSSPRRTSLISPGAAAMADVSAPLVTSFLTTFGNGATTTVLKWLTVIALTSSPNSYIFFMGQLLFAIAKDGYFPKFLAYEHPTRGTPVGALVFGTVMCETIAIVLHYTIGDANLGSALINLTLLGALISYVFQLLSYIYLAVRQPGRARPYRSPFGVNGAILGIALCGVAIAAILYSSLSDIIFLASIVVTVLVFMVGSAYYFKHVVPQIKNNTLFSPAAPKGVREKIVKRSQAGYHSMAPSKTGLHALSEVDRSFSREFNMVPSKFPAFNHFPICAALRNRLQAISTFSSRMSDPIPTLKELFIDGKWVAPVSKKYIDVINPANEEVIQQVAAASAPDVDLAVQAAKRAFETWSATTGAERAVYLRKMGELVAKRIDALSRLETLDNGKPLAEAVWDIEDVSGCFDYYAKAAEALDARQYEKVDLPLEDFLGALRYEPVGVVAAIIPWNYPALMALWKLAPALAAGCTVVLKPSEITPLSALQLAQVAADVGLPAGVLNVINGLGPRLDIKKISLELGGKSPAIVFDKVNIERTVEWVMFGCFWTNGQICSATSRLLVHESFADEFLELLVKETKKLVLGDPLDGKVQMGPLVSKAQQEKVLGYIQSAKDEGATVAQGTPPAVARDTLFPHNHHKVTKNMRVWKEEIFGPVLS
ncbi:Aldehyde dehydrogenase, glutamic acid active site [Phytophthora cactorum]|nr:Aldehyde dehydrogenase, glutamic acid active site [Phytophthora cactorum]